ncbi:uncharacterized protein CEXT_724651 [Caerostris extrusa]|uniref:Uncharacterized protein n=1 Tax=Caerostris extrusa TaxID=172846 RepID=A0AAV4W9X2_CAEEX|nr:uncharacterized protein CEXT_724651 [Caerostris extrusa]
MEPAERKKSERESKALFLRPFVHMSYLEEQFLQHQKRDSVGLNINLGHFRKTEDSLEEVADLLHLPTDLFSVRDPEDDVYEYTVFTKQRVAEGVRFGPYGGHLVKSQTDSANVIETKGSRWLKRFLLRDRRFWGDG